MPAIASGDQDSSKFGLD